MLNIYKPITLEFGQSLNLFKSFAQTAKMLDRVMAPICKIKLPFFKPMDFKIPRFAIGMSAAELEAHFKRTEVRLGQLETLFEIKEKLVTQLEAGDWDAVTSYVRETLRVNTKYLANRISQRVQGPRVTRNEVEQEICMFLLDYGKELDKSSFRQMSKAIGDKRAVTYLKYLIMNQVEERLKQHLIMENPSAIVPDNLRKTNVGISFVLERDEDYCAQLLLFQTQIKPESDIPEDVLMTKAGRQELRDALEAWRESLARRKSKHRESHLDLLNRFLCGEIESSRQAIARYDQRTWDLFLERARYFFADYSLTFA